MDIDPQLISRFAHDTLNVVAQAMGRLHLWDLVPSAGLDDPDTRRKFLESLNRLRQAIEDLQCLAACEGADSKDWTAIDWRELLRISLAPLKREGENIVRRMEGTSFLSQGDSVLLGHALENIVWFATNLSNPIQALSVQEIAKEGRRQIRLTFCLSSAEPVDPDFVRLTPFFPRSARTHSLESNTGLLLFAARAILERHSGSLTAAVRDQEITLELLCPLLSQ